MSDAPQADLRIYVAYAAIGQLIVTWSTVDRMITENIEKLLAMQKIPKIEELPRKFKDRCTLLRRHAKPVATKQQIKELDQYINTIKSAQSLRDNFSHGSTSVFSHDGKIEIKIVEYNRFFSKEVSERKPGAAPIKWHHPTAEGLFELSAAILDASKAISLQVFEITRPYRLGYTLPS